MNQPILSVKDLSVQFRLLEGTTRAVEQLSLDLFPGKCLAVVGESGSGKSVTARTILRILDRNAHVTSGEILLDPDTPNELDLMRLPSTGRRIRAIRGQRIALIFQEPMASLSMHYTVGNQLMEAVRIHSGVPRDIAFAKAVTLLVEVGIPNPAARMSAFPFQLSGGLRQRVGIALALAGEPDILIADEPTTALDVTTQAQVLNLLRKLQKERNLSLLLITHDLGVVAEMANEVLVMYLGRAVETGSVERVFASPQHPYTRALMRSMPRIDATPRERLATIGGAVPHPSNRPAGCPFHPRCEEKIDGLCSSSIPQPVRRGHNEASCFLVQETG